MKPRALRLLPSVLFLAVLAACGGGGGGSVSPPAVAPVTITATNAADVGVQALDAGNGTFLGDAVGVTGVQLSGTAARGPSALAAVGVAARLLRNLPASTQLVGATQTIAVPCTDDGSVEISVDLGSDETLSAGDTIDLDFRGCRESGVTLDGALEMSLEASNSDGTAFTANATATALVARAGTLGQRADGTIRIVYDETGATTSTLDVTSPSFTTRRLVGSTVRATRTLTDYSYRLVTTLATGAVRETFGFDARGDFPRLGEVSFNVATTAPVITPGGAVRPASGSAVVTGAQGTTLDLVVTATGVEWSLDRLGDGSVEATGLITWAQFDAAL